MLWTMAVILIVMWMLGLGSNLAMGLFIHILFAAAVALLVVSFSQEVTNNRMLRQVSRSREPKQECERRLERLADQSIPPRVPRKFGQIRGSIS
jgi:hypothetical protein